MQDVVYRLPDAHPAPLDLPVFVVSLDAYARLPLSSTDDQVRDALLDLVEPCVAPRASAEGFPSGDGSSNAQSVPGRGAASDGKVEARGYVLMVLCAADSTSSRQLGTRMLLGQLGKVERRYRKGLKRLYLLHPSTYTSTMLPLLSTLVSPKFLAKIHSVPSLTTLVHTHRVSLAGLRLSIAHLEAERIAQSSLQSGGGWTAWATAPIRAAASWMPVWSSGGADLPNPFPQDVNEMEKGWWHRNAEGLPELVSSGSNAQERGGVTLKELKQAILRGCVQTEGIFRKTPDASIRPTIIALLDLPLSLQPQIPWTEIARLDPALPPKCLLRLYSSMSEPLISSDLYPAIRETTDLASINANFLPLLPSPNREVLLDLMGTLHSVLAHEHTTRMSARNLAIVLAPDLIRGPNPAEDLGMCLERGKTLPVSLGGPASKEGANTLVGLLETMIQEEVAR